MAPTPKPPPPAPSAYHAAAGAPPAADVLQGATDARVIVVGGGFAGLNTALGLVERGMRDVVVLEAGRVGDGASGRNGGFVFAGYSRGEADLLRDLGPLRAKDLYSRTVAAVALVRERTKRHGIDCDRVDGGVLWANWFRDARVLERRQELLRDHFDSGWIDVSKDELRTLLHTERYSGALFEPEAFHFNPLKYARGLAATVQGHGGRVCESSAAQRLSRAGSGWRVDTAEGHVVADHVVLACGGYLSGLVPAVDAAVLPIATYIAVTAPLGARAASSIATNAAVYDTRFAFDYYRLLPDSRLLWGGRISVRDRSPAVVERLLRRDLARVYPQLADLAVEHAWSGLMSYGRHEMPQVGRQADGLWYAQAFGGHGVAPTTVAGELLAAAIADGDTAWLDFSRYGLSSAWKPWGFAAAQARYSSLQLQDVLKAGFERFTARGG